MPSTSGLFIALVVIVACVRGLEALVCYETTEDGYTEATGNWTYCGTIPSLIRNDGTYRPERAFGVNSDVDNTGPYDAFFKEERGFVKTLSFCILESYDFGQLYRSAGKRPPPEFLFRCVCAEDRCNDPNHPKSFLPRGVSPIIDAKLSDAAGISKEKKR